MIIRRGICGHSSLVEYQLPKLRGRVRFPLSAPFFLPKNPQATCTVLAAQAARTVQAALVMLSKLMNYQISANIFCLFVGKIKAGMNLCQRYCNTLYEMLKFPTNASKNVGKNKMEC